MLNWLPNSGDSDIFQMDKNLLIFFIETNLFHILFNFSAYLSFDQKPCDERERRTIYTLTGNL